MTRRVEAGKRTAQKLRALDPDYFKKLGSKGGRRGRGSEKGFAANPSLARTAGAKGGRISRRGKRTA